MKGILTGALMCLVFAGPAHARKSCEGIFPKNNMWIGVGFTDSGISQTTFNAVLDKLEGIYNPVAQAQGYSLVFNRLWDDGTVNSDTDVEGTNWVVNSYGGLARYNGMTGDGYAGVACHEIGHHLGGAPLFTDQDWASVEGEADYFAALKCLRKYFAGDDNQGIVAKMQIDPLVVAKCSADYAGNADSIAICERSASALYIIADVLRQLENDNPIAFNSPDPSVVTTTFEDHPAAQCRLDTYFAAGLCVNDPDALMSPTDPSVSACMTGDGARPRCWYAPPAN